MPEKIRSFGLCFLSEEIGPVLVPGLLMRSGMIFLLFIMPIGLFGKDPLYCQDLHQWIQQRTDCSQITQPSAFFPSAQEREAIQASKTIKGTIQANFGDLVKNYRRILRISPELQDLSSRTFRDSRCLSKAQSDLESCALKLSMLAVDPFLGTSNLVIPKEASLQAMEDLFENRAFHEPLDKFDKILSQRLPIKEILEKIENTIFPKIKKMLIKKVESLPFTSEQERQKVIDKIKVARIGSTECARVVGQYHPIVDILPQAAYQPTQDKMIVCSGLLRHVRDENYLMNMIGHELAHVLSPCLLNAVGVSPGAHLSDLKHPIPTLIQCLRSPESTNSPKPPNKTPRPFCDNDKLNEIIPDWFAVELMAEHMKSEMKNSTIQQRLAFVAKNYQGLCGSTGGGLHPSGVTRMNRIGMAHPEIRELLGCKGPAPAGYCNALTATPVRHSQISQGQRGQK